jgi:aminoglycoside phosphotransferase (APT) family kinase protein
VGDKGEYLSVDKDPFALDATHLARYLEHHVEGFRGPLKSEKFPAGQSNPTYRIRAASGDYVLRRKPPGKLLPSAHAVDREYRVLNALHDTAVAVAAPIHLCTDDDVIGSWFYLMEYIPGDIYFDPSLPDFSALKRTQCYNNVIETLAALHRVDPAAHGLSDYGKPGNYFSRQADRWTRQYRASESGHAPAFEALIDWLPRHIPKGDETVALLHGDYRIDNFIFHPGETTIAAVLDWELSTLGHPLADLAYFCMCLRLPRQGLIKGLAGVDREQLGIPGEQQIVARYCSLNGRPQPENWNFYLAFNFFRLAAIAQGVYSRAMAGNASSDQGRQVGKIATTVAQMGVDLTSH